MPSRNALERRIARMVNTLAARERNDEEFGPKVIFDSRKPPWLRIMWSGFLFISSCALLYQSYDRLFHYMEYPIDVDVQIEVIANVTFPKFAICTEDTEEMKEWLSNYPEINIKICIYMMYDLFNYEGLNLTTMWNAANTSSTITKFDINNGQIKPQLSSEVSPFGFCATFYSDEEIPYDGDETAFNVDLIKPEGTCQIGLLRVAYYPADEEIDYRNSFLLTPGYRRKISLAVHKYRFVDRPPSPCASHKTDYFKCMKTCRNNMYKKLSCKYPFIPADIDLPICNTSLKLKDDFQRAFSVFMGFASNAEVCGCIPSCEQLFYDLVIFTEETTGHTSNFSFYYRNGYHTIISERLAYGIISLCSDIGGNLGLCLGWSILDIIYWLNYLKSLKRHNKADLAVSHERDPLFKIVQKTFRRRFLQGKEDNKDRSALLVYGWRAFVLLCACSASYLVLARVVYYFSYPTKVVLRIEDGDTVQYPDITVCWESKLIASRLRLMANKKRIPLAQCALTLLDLMDPPLKLRPDKLWSWSTVSTERPGFLGELPNQNTSDVDLPYGRCAHYATAPVSQADTYYDFLVGRFKPSSGPQVPPKDIKVMINLPDEFINPVLYDLAPENSLTSFLLKLTVVHKEDQTYNRNAAMELTTCKVKCITQRMMKRLTCKMPYINADHLPTCNTSADARNTEAIYMEAFVATRPQQDCGCLAPKQYIIYDSRLNIDHKDLGVSLLVFYFGNTKVEHLSKVISYSASKLLSEVGGNLSAILGLSVVSMLEVVYKMYRKVFKKKGVQEENLFYENFLKA